MSEVPPTPNNNITQKVQLAISNWLKGQDIGNIPQENIFKGIERSERKLPCIVAECQTADHSAPYSGSWRAHGMIKIRSRAEDQINEDAHLERAGNVLNLFMTTTIITDLTGALDDFTCFQFVVTKQSYIIADGQSWVSFIEFEMECCGSRIT